MKQNKMFSNLSIVAHGGGEGERGKTWTPRQIFKKLPNKNAIKVIKPKLGHFFLESLDPLKQKSEQPVPCTFNPCVHLCIWNWPCIHKRLLCKWNAMQFHWKPLNENMVNVIIQSMWSINQNYPKPNWHFYSQPA